jgi:SpoVK/Ycf46/Vps4 family AAA+-type ATPase
MKMNEPPVFKTFIHYLDSHKEKKMTHYSEYIGLVVSISNNYHEIHNQNGAVDSSYSLMNNFYNYYSDSIWNLSYDKTDSTPLRNSLFSLQSRASDVSKEPFGNYLLWQNKHDVTRLIEKLIEKKKYCTIDSSINTLTDIINVINDNEYRLDTEYNIDLKSLHNIKSELKQLNSIIGMESMKQAVIDQLVYFIQELHIGKEVSDYKNTVFYGPPGTGKTDVAKIIGKMYSKLGILKNNVFKKVTRNDLIAGYLGQTAIKTRKVIDECLGGVLFIDEAYSLGNSENNDSYSKECLDVLCEAMSDNKNNLMVIIAGYEEELNETFFKTNQGLQSRFIWRFSMGEYSPKEMNLIFKKMALEQEWGFVDDLEITDRWFEGKKDTFKNYGRDMELLLTYTKIAHGRRVYGKEKDLRKKISLDDINKGYQTLIKNRKEKPTPVFMHGIYV